MTAHIIYWFHKHPALCICGHSFGYCTAYTSPDPRKSFIEAKREHFQEWHPRRYALGRIG